MTYADAFNIRTELVKFNDVADALDGVLSRANGGVTAGAANAYTALPAPAWQDLEPGRHLLVAVHAANTGPATLAVSGLTPRFVTYKKKALVGGELAAGAWAHLVWDGGTFELLNHGGGWATWAPTYSASGSMTFTAVTTNLARYQRHGSRVVVRLQATGTTGGTASFGLRFTLPLAAADPGAAVLAATAYDAALAARSPAGCEFTSGTVAQVVKYDLSNWGLAAGKSVQVSGEYEAAA
jgi:hypothetical protein